VPVPIFLGAVTSCRRSFALGRHAACGTFEAPDTTTNAVIAMKRSWPIYIITLAGMLGLVAVAWASAAFRSVEDGQTEAEGVPLALLAAFVVAALIGVHCVAMFAATPSWRRRRLYVTRVPWTPLQALVLFVVLLIGPEFTVALVANAAEKLGGQATHGSRPVVAVTGDGIQAVDEETKAGSGDGAGDNSDEGGGALESYARLATLVVAAAILVLAAVVMRSHGRNLWRGLGFSSRRLWRHIGIGVVAYFAFTWALLPVLETAIRFVFEVFGWEMVEHEALTQYRETTSVFGRVALIVAIGLTAPFFEEVIFRGVLFQAIKRYAGSAVGIVVSALVFSLLHPGAFVIVNIFFLGLLFGYLFDLTGSIVPGIVLHFLFNATTMLFLMLYA